MPKNESKQSSSKKGKAQESFPVQTGQEANAMLRAVSDGKSGRYWQTVAGANSRVHQVPGAAEVVGGVVGVLPLSPGPLSAWPGTNPASDVSVPHAATSD